MKRILITGATGNTGFETIRFLSENNSPNKIIAGVRNIERVKNKFVGLPGVEFVEFDFENENTFELTGYEYASFYEVVNLLNESANTDIRYKNVNPLKFYSIKKKEGMKSWMILVMTLLHFVRRFQKDPQISGFYERLTGKKPTTLKDFFEREKIFFYNR